MTAQTARRLHLHDEHIALGARMTDSDGWLLPLEYSGAHREYRAHRRAAVLWDASNLGLVQVTGPGAFDVIHRTFTNDLRRSRPGRTQYTLLLSPATAGVLDDLMVWWVAGEHFVLTPSRPGAVLDALRAAREAACPAPCEMTDISAERVLLALQGADAARQMRRLAPEAAPARRYRVHAASLDGQPAVVSTTAFGRQLGFEMLLPVPAGRRVLRRLIEAGVTPAGLAMRETHRVEAGILRHGFELAPSATPLESGCTDVVAFGTPFAGRDALLAHRARGAGRVLRTVLLDTRQAPSPGDTVLWHGSPAGEVTSGNFSPRLHRGLGFAFVRPAVSEGSPVTVRTARGEIAGRLAGVPIDLEAA